MADIPTLVVSILLVIAAYIAIFQRANERKIEFILEKFYEHNEKPVDSDWSIRILHPNKPIEKCIVLYNDIPLPWSGEGEYEKRLVKNGGGNVRIPREIQTEGAKIRILNDKKILRGPVKFEEIHTEKP